MVSELCQPVGWPAKCHTKRCLELQDNPASHMTFVGVADMSARLIVVLKHMLIFLVFLQCILILFFLLHFLGWQIYYLVECLLLPYDWCLPFSALFYGPCLLLKGFLVYQLSIGIYCWIFVNIVEYFC